MRRLLKTKIPDRAYLRVYTLLKELTKHSYDSRDLFVFGL